MMEAVCSFERREEIEMVKMAVLNNLQENDFWKCFNSWKQCWNSCIAASGNCFEGR
jgi:hypothetical protein